MDTASSSGDARGAAQACTSCHGAGTVLMSLCCGRGCATCPGDGMLENVECPRCSGRGWLPPPDESSSGD